MLRRSDRYILREAVGPFVLALSGLVLFIILNVILSLSDLMVDRGLGMAVLIRLVLFKVPSLLVVAVPMSALFATFLALGRMIHDREIVAFESLGIPLRRLLVPLLTAAFVVAAADFAVYNWLVPASETAYQEALRAAIFRQGVPRITSNAFFKGQDDQFFYIRRYEESTGQLFGIHIYDTTGRLFPQAGTQVTMLTAEKGVWTGGAWQLESAAVYGFDRDGTLMFSATVESLSLPIDQSVAELVSRSRSSSEMGIGELAARISQAKASGQRIEEYVVEIHMKLALPLAAVLFVLLAGSLSLAFLPRSRATSIVLGLLLVALYQGVLWWTQTLGRRGVMDAALAAWIPNLLFGAGGVLLFFRIDHIASRDAWSRLKRCLRPLGLGLCIAVVVVGTLRAAPDDPVGEIPLRLECDELFVSQERSIVRATGSVTASYSDTILHADTLVLERLQTDSWRLAASGRVSLVVGASFDVSGDALEAELDVSERGAITRRARATSFSGRSRFTNSVGELHTLVFAAETGTLEFADGDIALIEAERAEFTTCDECCTPLRARPYSLSARRLLLYPERLLVAHGLAGRVAGLGIVWLPIYVQPLRETLDAPLFPAIGRSATRGWFAKWNVPFFVNPSLYGSVLLDAYSRYAEVGVGGMLRFDVGFASGQLAAYAFPAVVGDSELRLRFDASGHFTTDWSGTASLAFARIGSSERLTFALRANGATRLGAVAVTASRETLSQQEGPARVLERLPDVSIAPEPARVGPVILTPTLSGGFIREGIVDGDTRERWRALGRIDAAWDTLSIAGFAVQPKASADWAVYGAGSETTTRAGASLEMAVVRNGLRVTWRRMALRGSSPFLFDAATSDELLQWSVSERGRLALTLSGSASRNTGLGAVRLSIVSDAAVPCTFTVAFDPNIGRLSSLSLSGSWSDDHRALRWSVPFDAARGQFAKAEADCEARMGGVSLSLETDFDLNALALTSGDLEAEVDLPGGWGLALDASYIPARSVPLSLSYGVFRSVAECLRVGVERRGGQIWLYASVLAFPEAVVRYSPQTMAVDVGS